MNVDFLKEKSLKESHSNQSNSSKKEIETVLNVRMVP